MHKFVPTPLEITKPHAELKSRTPKSQLSPLAPICEFNNLYIMEGLSLMKESMKVEPSYVEGERVS